MTTHELSHYIAMGSSLGSFLWALWFGGMFFLAYKKTEITFFAFLAIVFSSLSLVSCVYDPIKNYSFMNSYRNGTLPMESITGFVEEYIPQNKAESLIINGQELTRNTLNPVCLNKSLMDYDGVAINSYVAITYLRPEKGLKVGCILKIEVLATNDT